MYSDRKFDQNLSEEIAPLVENQSQFAQRQKTHIWYSVFYLQTEKVNRLL